MQGTFPFKFLNKKEPLMGLIHYLVFDQRSTIVSFRYLCDCVSSCATSYLVRSFTKRSRIVTRESSTKS